MTLWPRLRREFPGILNFLGSSTSGSRSASQHYVLQQSGGISTGECFGAGNIRSGPLTGFERGFTRNYCAISRNSHLWFGSRHNYCGSQRTVLLGSRLRGSSQILVPGGQSAGSSISGGCPTYATQSFQGLPPLMDSQPLVWPSFINSIRNWIFTYMVIRPYMDHEFTIPEFERGAREAVSLISKKLAANEFDDLEGLVDAKALAEVKRNIAKYNVGQRDSLSVEADDIYFSFPYQIGIIIPDRPQSGVYYEDEPPPQVRHVEITMVFHVLRGIASQVSSAGRDHGDMSSFMQEYVNPEEAQKRLVVCNYRFFRDFTAGCEDSSWVVNQLNHFKPTELI